MNLVLFLLVAIFGLHVEGIKVRAIRRRFIEYPYVSDTKYAERVPIYMDPKMQDYLDDIRSNTYGGYTYGDYLNRNSADTINKPHIFWIKENEPETSQAGEGRSGQTDDNDQNLREEDERTENSVDQSDSSSSQRPSSDNGDQNNNILSPNKLNSADSTKIEDIDTLNESYTARTVLLSATTDKILLNNENGKNKENNLLPSTPIDVPFISTSKGNINTVDQSEINVKNYKKRPLRYTAVKYNMLPPLNRRLYSVDGIKINRKSEALLDNNMDEVRVDKEDAIRLVPEHDLITLDADSKYSVDQSKYNMANIAPLKNDIDEINVNNEERIVFANESPKKASLKNIQHVINVGDEKNMVPAQLMGAGGLISTGDDSKYFVDESLYANSKNANYAYYETEKEGKNRVPFYPYLTNQQWTRGLPRNLLWKQVNISLGKRPHSIIYNTRRNWRVHPVAEDTSLLNKLMLKLCRKCEYLMKALNITQTINMLNGPFDHLETTGFEDNYDYEYDDNINIPQERISWDYLQGESQEEPIYGVRYYQPHTQFRKVLKKDNPQINTVKEPYAYRGFQQSQLYPAELVDDKIETNLPNAYNPQVYPFEPMNDTLKSYIFMNGNKNYLQPAYVKPHQIPAETQFDFSKPTTEILQLEHESDTKEDSNHTPEVDYWNNAPEQLTPSVVEASEIHKPAIHVNRIIPEYLLPSKSPDSSETHTTHTTATSEDATEIPATFTPLLTHWYTISEESPLSKTQTHASNFTSEPTDWNTTSEEFLYSKTPDVSHSTTYSSLATGQNDETTPEKSVPSKAPDTSETFPTKTTVTSDWNTKTEELKPSKAPDASETPPTYSPIVTEHKDENTIPTEFLVTKAAEAVAVPSTYAPFSRNDGTTILEESPSKATETPTTNPPLVPNRKDGTAVPEELTSKAFLTTTNIPLAPNWKDGITVPEEMATKASEASETPTTNPSLATNWKDGTTIPEKNSSNVSDSGEIPTTYIPLVTYRKDRKTTLKEQLSSKASDASKKSMTYAAPATNEKDRNTTPEKQSSKSPKAIEIPTTSTRTIPEPSKSFDAMDITAADVPLANHRNPITVKWFPSTEPEVNVISTTYGPLSSDRSTVSKELLSSKAFEVSEILTTLTPLATHQNTIPEKKIPFKSNIPLATDQNAIVEEFFSSNATEAIYISTTSTPLATHRNTITEKTLSSKTPDTSDISTTEEFLPSKAHEAVEISTLSTPLATHRNTITEKWLPSEAPNAVDIPKTYVPLATGRSAIPEELTSKVPYGSVIPVSVIYDWDMSEYSETSKPRDEFEIPTRYTPIPTGWAIITKETVRSEVPDISNMSATDIPDEGKKPKQMLSQAPGESTVVTVNEDDWIEISKKRLFSKGSLKLGSSYTPSLKDENKQLEQLPNLEEATPEQYIIQVINILLPDLLRLYSSKCYKGVDEELLKGLKAIIDSVQQNQCDTS